jgi:acid phosphatase family membrane protein YuiD
MLTPINKLLITPILAWLIAHSIKVILFAIKEKRIDIYQFYRAGGMPSGHSATVSALSLALYFNQGLTPLFIVSLIFSIIVIRDTHIRPKESRHTISQVIAGIILGLVLALVVNSL